MKHRILLFLLLALGISAPLKAQDDLYLGLGYSKQAGALRLGLVGYTFGAEVYLKSDINRPFKSVSQMDGTRHRFSAMGGLTYNFIDFIHLTANVGYGSAGIYRRTATAEGYGVEGLARGLEVGGVADVFLGDLISVFVGWSRIFAQKNGPYSEFTFGFGLRL